MHFNEKFPFSLGAFYEDTKWIALDFTPSLFSEDMPNGQWVERTKINERWNYFSNEL